MGVVQDAMADPQARRKAAVKLAEYLLPKTPVKAKALVDEYGFRVSHNRLSAYRNVRSKLRALMKESQRTRKSPAIAQQIETLEDRSAAILRGCEAPCPSKYSRDAVKKDDMRLMDLAELRGNGTGLSEAEEIEETHVSLRYRLFRASPEAIACRRLKALEDAERAYEQQKFLGKRSVKRLSRSERNDLELLRRLYGQPFTREIEDDAAFVESFRYHPFRDELPSSNGYFYPPVSQVRPKGVGTITWSGWPPITPPGFYRDSLVTGVPSGELQKTALTV
jgi:hypothetical protein